MKLSCIFDTFTAGTFIHTCNYLYVLESTKQFRGVKFKSSFVYQTYSKRHTCTLTMHGSLNKLHLILASVVNVGLYGRIDNVTTRYIYIHRYPKNSKMVIISYISIWDNLFFSRRLIRLSNLGCLGDLDNASVMWFFCFVVLKRKTNCRMKF